MEPIHEWLMQGDPAVRWQTMRDLLGEPAQTWQAEQARTVEEGWGARLLAYQDPDGRWGGGLYSPKWISSTYTLLALRGLGIPRATPAAQRGAAVLLDGLYGPALNDAFRSLVARMDRCIVGMTLQICAYFQVEDERLLAIARNVADELMPDGAWNCRKGRDKHVHHSSMHTTLNVLEGLRDYLDFCSPPDDLRRDLQAAEAGALEFLLRHQLYRSHQTGEVISEKFLYLSYPSRWFYDVLRGLCYFAHATGPQGPHARRDPRLQDPIDLLISRRRPDGFWPLQYGHGGKVFFNFESNGKPSRINTLRALRVLKWWEQ